MNREILFRGKCVDHGEWVEGHLYITHDGTHEIGRYNSELNIERWTAIVDPATVGQYTGLKDKNGRRIFEGDVVVSTSERRLANSRYVVNHSALSGYWMCDPKREPKIVGNIHDNPELMGGAHE